MKTIEYELYQDKILGGLLGIAAGSRYGAHWTGRRSFTMAPLPDLQKLPNFGTAGQSLMMLYLALASQKGARLRESDLGDLWKSHVHLTTNGFGIACRNLRLGLYPPQSGVHNNPIWCTSMEAPARAPFWGFLNPGMPEQAAYYAGMDAAIDHDGMAVDASSFLAALTAMLYFEDDIKRAMEQSLAIFHHHCPFTELAEYAIHVFDECLMIDALGKIASRYSGSHLSDAPMNMGFLLIAMLETKLQDPWVMLPIIGHDAQSTGAILGALTGFRIGAEKWDDSIRALSAERPEIVDHISGREFPQSYFEMAHKVAQAGVSFIEFYDHLEVSGNKPRPLRLESPRFHLSVFPVESHVVDWRGDHKLSFEYENLSEVPQEIQLVMNSPSLIFKNPIVNLTAADWEIVEMENTCRLSSEALEHLVDSDMSSLNATFPYSIEVIIDSEMVAKIQRGLPFYGSWMLIGPFAMKDRAEMMNEQQAKGGDEIFAPPETEAPEFTYLGKLFSLEQVRRLAETKNLDEFPFQTIPFQPSGFQIDFTELLHGHGPQALFLFTHLHSRSAQTVHLMIYCSANVTLWCNGERLAQKPFQPFVERPYQISVRLTEGLNDLFIQLTPVNEYLNFYFAIREADDNEEPGEWTTELIPFL